MEGVAILGSTGSIGQSTLSVIARNANAYRVVALTAQRSTELLLQQCEEFNPDYAVVVDEHAAELFSQQIKKKGLATTVLSGSQALEKVVSLEQVSTVVAAIVGASGLLSTLAAAQAGKKILLANKESLVMAGELLLDTVQKSGAQLIPVDSEHNALFQCMPAGFKVGQAPQGVQRVILTASGGPFREMSLDAMMNVTPEQACDHPNWKMGKKISVDSATMMNKSLEVIEAYWLFRQAPELISVVIHPQSIVHSFVEYDDGSLLAQLGNPDMRTAIACSLAWPERISSGVKRLDVLAMGSLEFYPVDAQRYPSLRLAYEALKNGGTQSCILNAANEMAVAAFLEHKINFVEINRLIEFVLETVVAKPVKGISSILEADKLARECAISWLNEVNV